MNQTTYQEYLSRLPEEDPYQICRLCVQETQNMIASSDPAFYQIRILYECITNLKVMDTSEQPYFMCTECINMLREIREFQKLLRLSDMFWKKYVKNEPSNIKQTKYESLNQIYIESIPLEADDVDFAHCFNELKDENDASDVEMESMYLSYDNFDEMSYNTNTIVVDLKIDRCCDICDEEFACKNAFEKHMALHERRFNCAHCGMSFKSKAAIILHLQQIHNEGVATDPYKWICTNCDNLELSSKVSLRAHVQQCHGPENESKCPDCNRIFGNLKKLRWHMTTHREKPFQCTKCSRKFKNKSFLDKHTAMHANFRPYVCELCGLRVTTNNALKRHILGVHEMKKQKKYRRTIKCTLCEVEFPKLIEAKEHFSAKHTKADWKEFRSLCCGCCYIRFDSTVQREQHYSQYQANHDKSKTRLKTFGPRNYVSWRLTERPHQCDICKNTYKTPDTLKGHMKMHHKKPRPFTCEYCGSTHALAYNLRLHILRAHTDDRPFRCSDCDYNCVTRTELKNHNKWHHSDK